jgi:hypothetical protein
MDGYVLVSLGAAGPRVPGIRLFALWVVKAAIGSAGRQWVHARALSPAAGAARAVLLTRLVVFSCCLCFERSCVMSQVVSTYRVVLFPRLEVAARGLSLREAEAWVQTYNQIMQSSERQAMIAEEEPARKAA